MADWYKKISREELKSFLEKFGKLVSTSIVDGRPSCSENLETKKVSKFYFEGNLFEVVSHFTWEFHSGNGWTYGGGHTEKEGNVISINVL